VFEKGCEYFKSTRYALVKPELIPVMDIILVLFVIDNAITIEE
jgi:hypothetical protein